MFEILNFNDVSRVYTAGDHELRALDHIDLSLPSGKFIVVLGPSGAGKSTLLNLIGGLDSPTEGRITVDGREARQYASQGQCRTAAVALKLASRHIMEKELGVIPLLLLDDILSELDTRRQDYVLNRIDRGQIFITGCEDETARRLRAGRIFEISAGTVAGRRDFGQRI